MTQLAEPTQSVACLFAAPVPTLSGITWLDDLRRVAWQHFQETGFPSTSEEDWRLTNLAPIARTAFRPAAIDLAAGREILGKFTFAADAAAEMVFVNGLFAPTLSSLDHLPASLQISSLAKSPHEQLGRLAIHANALANLNTAAFADGAMVRVAKSATIPRPIHLLFLSTLADHPAVSHPRTLILAEPNSEFAIVETYAGVHGGYFTNAVTEIFAGDDSRIDHNRLQQESHEACHISTTSVRMGRGTRFVSHSSTLGGKLTRNDLSVLLSGQYGQATVNGLVLLDGTRHCDNHTLLDHAATDCPSHELYKHVLAGKSTGVFAGKILVRPGSQKTDSKQTSKTLLLSDDACMNSQPALEIYADDVKCTHGSTTGPMDEEQVFYLRSRGVQHDAARQLLTYAFAADVTRRIKVEPVRRRLEDYMAQQQGLPTDLRIADLGGANEAVVNS